MKILPNTKEKVSLRVASSEHQRAEFLQYIDQVEDVKVEKHSYVRLKKLARQKYPYKKIERNMYMELNSWLEKGRRIEDYLPHFDMEYKLNWKISRYAKTKAEACLKPGKNIVIQTSSVKFNAKKDFVGDRWKPYMWDYIVRGLKDEIPGVNIIWLGADWDRDMYDRFPLDWGIMPMAGATGDVVMHLLRKCTGVISYQSGISVLSVCEKIPTFMIYFDWLKDLHYSFNPPGGNYHPTSFTKLGFDCTAALSWASKLV